MFRPFPVAVSALFLGLAAAGPAWAHFLEIIPNTDIVDESGDRMVTLDLTFTHPMERGPAMDMAAPKRVGVVGPAGKVDLTKSLTTRKTDNGKQAYSLKTRLDVPADYVFYVEPAPYWEPAEAKMITHYSKVVVDMGSGAGWDAKVGFPVEIEPLVRPYGIWTGNLFRGIVRRDGKPVPFAEIEVEWKNDGSVSPPSDPFITQVIKADAHGTFAYAVPRAGWWGFAALVDGPRMKNPQGKEVESELGALIWVRAADMK